MLDNLFADLLKKHSINEVYKMDILELLRLTNLSKTEEVKVTQSNSFFDLL